MRGLSVILLFRHLLLRFLFSHLGIEVHRDGGVGASIGTNKLGHRLSDLVTGCHGAIARARWSARGIVGMICLTPAQALAQCCRATSARLWPLTNEKV